MSRKVEGTLLKGDLHVKTSPEWGGFTRGESCRIKGERGVYQFIGHCLHTDTGNEWVALYGGPNGTGMFRYVDPTAIKRVPRKKA